MQGTSGSFACNGTSLTLQPSGGQWLERESFGIAGDAKTVYSAVRQFEMQFQLLSPSDFNQFLGFYTSSAASPVVMDLPQYDASAYQFKSYTGCSLREPVMGPYFNGYPSEVRLTVYGIRT